MSRPGVDLRLPDNWPDNWEDGDDGLPVPAERTATDGRRGAGPCRHWRPGWLARRCFSVAGASGSAFYRLATNRNMMMWRVKFWLVFGSGPLAAENSYSGPIWNWGWKAYNKPSETR